MSNQPKISRPPLQYLRGPPGGHGPPVEGLCFTVIEVCEPQISGRLKYLLLILYQACAASIKQNVYLNRNGGALNTLCYTSVAAMVVEKVAYSITNILSNA